MNKEEFGRLGSVFLQRPSHYGGQREAEQTAAGKKYRGTQIMFGFLILDVEIFGIC